MALNPTTVANLPAEFVDKLSQELLLQPDYEFLFARWAYSALVQNSLSGMDGFDLAKVQMIEGRLPSGAGAPSNIAEAMSSGMGGPLAISMGMAFPDLVKFVREAKMPGEVIKINRPKFIDGATTESSRKLSNVAKVFGTSSQPVLMEQVSLTIQEYGGPGDSTGAIVPISLARYTQARSEHDLLQQVGYELRRDRYKFVDDLMMTRLIAAANAGSYVTFSSGLSAASSFSGNGNEPFTFTEIVKAVEQLKTRKIPGVGGAGKYIAVLDVHQIADLKQDPQYQKLAAFTGPEFNPLFPGYMRTVENVIICESTRMPRLTASIGSATTAYQGLVLAPGSLGWACAEDAHAIRDRNDDGGRFSQFAWNSYEALEILDDRFGQLIISD